MWNEQYTVRIDHLKPLNFFTPRSPEYVLQKLVLNITNSLLIKKQTFIRCKIAVRSPKI
ncbi:hypothetical protein [Nostoc sp. 'Peltigera malacea cyanobiont' DB3992]|uniref:hypothetical protein n=1 Tax=Nostoc sp. 'Peltigera malacea cyanobiont' DB3992 TaxID=1206980 RepID=UPI0015D495B6|nr:hypothetical protein [Nostoc sp. 'Peltigera malacea cyanobiont' DB3992]